MEIREKDIENVKRIFKNVPVPFALEKILNLAEKYLVIEDSGLVPSEELIECLINERCEYSPETIRQETILRLMKNRMGVEDIRQIACKACNDCIDPVADCVMVFNIAEAIHAEQTRRIQG